MFSTHGPTRPKPVQTWAFVVLVLVVGDEPRVPYHNQRAPWHSLYSACSLDRLKSKSWHFERGGAVCHCHSRLCSSAAWPSVRRGPGAMVSSGERGESPPARPGTATVVSRFSIVKIDGNHR